MTKCESCGRPIYASRVVCGYCELWLSLVEEWLVGFEYGFDRAVIMLVTAIQTDAVVESMTHR
jgi:hypothetical protein